MTRRNWPREARVEIAVLDRQLSETERALEASERALRSARRRIDKLEQQLASAQATIAHLQATIREYAHQLFGQHSERGAVAGSDVPEELSPATATESEASPLPSVPPPTPPTQSTPKRRGARPGHPGHTRSTKAELPCIDEVRTLPEDQRRCPKCGQLYEPMPGMFAISLVAEWVTVLFYRRYLRQKYHKACNCPGGKPIKVAPPPAKVIAKGLLSPQFLARVCVEKFWLGHPLHRILQGIGLHSPAQPVSRGGITGMLKHLGPLLEPLYAAICEQVRQAAMVGADETTATVHTPEGEPLRAPDHRPRWWLWCFRSRQAIAFLLRQGRDGGVPAKFFGWDTDKTPPEHPLLILVSDCYVVYKGLAGWVLNACCWAHQRRLFLKVARKQATPTVAHWAEQWRRRIHTLYTLAAARRQAAPAQWDAADKRLRAHVDRMRATAKRELLDATLSPPQHQVLKSMLDRWAGLTLFLDHPEVPLDNNELERTLRGPVVGRKNFLLFGNLWSAHLAEMLWSILATAILHGLNPLTYLTAYLQACAENGGQPLTGASLQRFLPWAVSAEDRATWSAPPPAVTLLAVHPRTPVDRRRRQPCRRPLRIQTPVGVDSS